ncbi:MAG: metalloregulator ArsR/SmtB family transcription factor [Nitrospiraceae bacterium]|nr:metalloregulator ArsR/SmtB family transcription factor [Nitrospiraceae bacterium]
MGSSSSERLDILKVVAHPVRLRILDELLKGVKCVSDFEDFLGMRQPNVSQHLAALRNRGLIDFYMDGRLRCYFLVDPIIPDLLNVLKKEYDGPIPPPACCPITKKGKYPGDRKR